MKVWSKLGHINVTGSEMNTGSVNSLRRKHVVIHSTKLRSIHTHPVMNRIHWYKVSVQITTQFYILCKLFFHFQWKHITENVLQYRPTGVFACNKSYPKMHAFTWTWRFSNLLQSCWVFMNRLQKMESDIKALGPAYIQQTESPQ